MQFRLSRPTLFRLLALSIVVILLGAVEGLLRVLPWRPPSREESLEARNLISIEHFYRHHAEFFVVWEQQDGVDICGPAADLCRGTKSRENGMQWDRFPCQKPPGSFRIVTLGGSSTQGFGVDASETFATRLEQELATRTDRAVEVVNAGVAGYNSVQIRQMLPSLRFLEPDLFVLYAGHNDYNYFMVADAAELTPAWMRSMRNLGDRLMIWRGLRALLQTIRPPPGLANRPQVGWGRPGGARQRSPRYKDTTRPVPTSRTARRALIRQEQDAQQIIDARFRDSVQALAHEAQDLGAEVMLASPVCRLRDPPIDSIHWHDLPDDDLAPWDEAWNILKDTHPRDPSTQLQQALAIDDSYAHLRHAAGEWALRNGDLVSASQQYRAALDLNPPTSMDRAPPHHAALMAEIASDLGFPYVDFWPIFAAAATVPGLPGDEFFGDTIHPNPAGHTLIAHSLADAIMAEDWLNAP